MRTKMAEDTIQKMLQGIYDLPSVKNILRQEKARTDRGDAVPNWLDAFAESIVASKTVDAKIDDVQGCEANKHHTVESMVKELRKRVKLDDLLKTANYKFPLSENQVEDAEIAAEMKNFIDDIFSSHYGRVDTPSVIYELRERFDQDTFDRHSELINKAIKENKEMYSSGEAKLDSFDSGSPIPANMTDTNFPLFEHVGGL